jgi:hypothetical protein
MGTAPAAVPGNDHLRVVVVSQRDDLPAGGWSPFVLRPSLKLELVRDVEAWREYFRIMRGVEVPEGHIIAYLEGSEDGHDFMRLVNKYVEKLSSP